MDRIKAYAALADELDTWCRLPPAALVAWIGRPAAARTIRMDSEDVAIEISVMWAGVEHDRVRIGAVALGPSHWRTERLEESVVVPLG